MHIIPVSTLTDRIRQKNRLTKVRHTYVTADVGLGGHAQRRHAIRKHVGAFVPHVRNDDHVVSPWRLAPTLLPDTHPRTLPLFNTNAVLLRVTCHTKAVSRSSSVSTPPRDEYSRYITAKRCKSAVIALLSASTSKPVASVLPPAACLSTRIVSTTTRIPAPAASASASLAVSVSHVVQHSAALFAVTKACHVLLSLSHPNLVAIFHISPDGDMHMERMQISLQRHMLRAHTCSAGAKLAIARHVTSALQYLYLRDVQHEDLCPNNILLAWQHGEMLVKLCDFYNEQAGCHRTAASAAPEVVLLPARDVTAAADVWALGCCLLFMEGAEPFTGFEHADAILLHLGQQA